MDLEDSSGLELVRTCNIREPGALGGDGAYNSYHLLMSVEDPDVVDFVSIALNGDVQLTTSDHLEWHDSLAHQYALQEKLNGYLDFAASGELVERFPVAKGRSIVSMCGFNIHPMWLATSFCKQHVRRLSPRACVLSTA